jgi:hypothetical protein
MRTSSISSKYIFNSTTSLNLILAIAISSFAPVPNTAPLPSTNTPTASLPTIGIGKDIIINIIAVEKEI